jgi:hypothetical protein
MRNITAVIAMCAAVASAQVTVEPDIVTDSLDIFAGSDKPARSGTGQAFASFIIPGLGHQISGRSGRAMPYFCAEALFICGAIFTESYSKRVFTDSRSYAWLYAKAPAAKMDEYYWKNVGSFMDFDEYNRVMELNRTSDDKYSETNQFWRWSDESLMDEYVSMRETATRFHVASSFFVAAMLLNRVISFVDMRNSMRNPEITTIVSIRFLPSYSIFLRTAGIQIKAFL